jgi:3-dehydroquinate synthase
MSEVLVRAERDYVVEVGSDWLISLKSACENRQRVALIISDAFKERISDLDLGNCEVFTFAIGDGEAGKSSETLLKVWNWLGAAGFTRSDLIVGIGGGAVTDFAGFAAATWLRGLDWIAIPTTVAGAVDAAIGGKTAINSDYGKNLIGSFHSPIKVVIDLNWLTTLSDRDFAAGLAEVVKAGFIADGEILNLLRGKDIQAVRSNPVLVQELIERSVKVKAEVVSIDFKESFAREALNYGHTLGHAVELDANYSLRHGECVSIGMAFIAQLQLDLGLISQDLADDHIKILSDLDLPTTYKRESWPKLLAHMAVDKKSRGKTLRFVTISEIGKTERLENPDPQVLYSAFEKVSS